jgi:hypothetical protein
MRVFFVSLVLLLSACTDESEVLVAHPCYGFHIGETTESEVISRCGQPASQINSATGSTLDFRNFGSGLQIFQFDRNGVLIGSSDTQNSPLSIQPYSAR